MTRSVLLTVAAGAFLAACSDSYAPVEVQPAERRIVPAAAMISVSCTASRVSLQVSCGGSNLVGPRGTIIGGQNQYLRLTSSNVIYNSGTEIFQFDVTVQNLLNEAIGTPDGVTADTGGIKVFFHEGPTMTSGSGDIFVSNADGTETFTGSDQPYFRYSEVLSKDEVSGAKTWQMLMPATVLNFTFKLYISAEVQPLLVINEVIVNPSPIVSLEQPYEWFEIYNAGTLAVNLQNMVIADSAASGRRPYHAIASSLPVASGGYVVLGSSTNTTLNGGAPVDYTYGTALSLANSLDAVKIARVFGYDTLTIDRTQYSQASVSAKEGISRELKNPGLDNSNMDDSNWGDASVTSVYGSGGRGTPKAQNSVYTP
jgi:hypothetical protein